MAGVMDALLRNPFLAALGVLAIVYYAATTYFSYRKLQQFRGPRLAAFSQLWLFKETTNGDLYLTLDKTLHKYGSPARIGPNMIVTDDPEIFRRMTAVRSDFRRGHWYRGMQFDPRINNLLSERDEKRHTELRAKMMPGYTGKEVPDLERKIDARLMDLVNLIQREYVHKKEIFDFSKVVQYFTLDSLSDIAFGQPFGFLEKNTDLYDYNKSSTEFFPIMELGTNIPFIHSILSSRFMQALAGPKPEDKAGLGAIIGVAQKIVAERFDSTSEKDSHGDMLDAFIRHGLTQLEVESESLLQILAGSDSTATTIRMTWWYIMTNPPVYLKLRTEIDTAIKDGRVSFPVIQSSEAAELPYLQACIKEGLRMWTPLNGIQTKIAPAEGATIGSVYIPGGTQVALNLYHMMHRQDFFGPDAALFNPERWFKDGETVKGYEKVFELSFASGRFTCLGKGVAQMELNKIFVELLRRFDFGIADPVNTMQTQCFQIHVQRNMNLRVWARPERDEDHKK